MAGAARDGSGRGDHEASGALVSGRDACLRSPGAAHRDRDARPGGGVVGENAVQVGRAAARDHARRRHRGCAAAAVPGEYPVTGAGDGRRGDGQVAASGLGEGADALSTSSSHGSRRSDRQIPGAAGERRDSVSRSVDAGRCDGYADSSLIRCADALCGSAGDVPCGGDPQAAGSEVRRQDTGPAGGRRGSVDGHVGGAVASFRVDRDADSCAAGDDLSGGADGEMAAAFVQGVDSGGSAGDRRRDDGGGLREGGVLRQYSDAGRPFDGARGGDVECSRAIVYDANAVHGARDGRRGDADVPIGVGVS